MRSDHSTSNRDKLESSEISFANAKIMFHLTLPRRIYFREASSSAIHVPFPAIGRT